MSLALVSECAREVGRLVQAGSNLARGDFRLARLREPLRAAGAQAPVFARLAEAVGALVEAEAADGADRLLGLATLTQAVLATQAGPGVGAGEWRPLATTPAPGATTVGHHQLEPLLTALSTTGPGRLEAVRGGWEQGCFGDLRLAPAAVRGLGDPLADVAVFLAQTVLPGYGPAIVPLLRVGLDLQGGKAHARRLALLDQLSGPSEIALYREAAENGSKEIKAAAVRALRHDAASIPRLRELAKKGPKEVRAGALEALAHLEPAGSIPLLVEGLRGPAGQEVASAAVRANRSPALTAALLAAGRAELQALRDARARSAACAPEGFLGLLGALTDRPDPENVAEFLGECLEQTPWLALVTGENGETLVPSLPDVVAHALQKIGSPRALGLLAATRGRFDQWLLRPAFRAAVGCLSPSEVFDGFAPYLAHQQPECRELVIAELGALTCFSPAYQLGPDFPYLPHHPGRLPWTRRNLPPPGGPGPIVWDARWRERLLEFDGWKNGEPVGPRAQRVYASKLALSRNDNELPVIIAALVTPDDAASLRYLEFHSVRIGADTPTSEWSFFGESEYLVLLGLVQGGHPRAAEHLGASARRLAKSGAQRGNFKVSLLRAVAQKLPPAGLAAFRQQIAALPESDVRAELLAPPAPGNPAPAVLT